MIEREYDTLDAINIVLHRLPNTRCSLITTEEIEIIPEMLQLPKPFADLNDVFSSETKPTMSLIILYSSSVVKELESMAISHSSIKKLKEELFNKCNVYLLKYEQNDICR